MKPHISVGVLAVALTATTLFASYPPRYFDDNIATQGYFREHPTLITHYEAPTPPEPQVPYYTPPELPLGYTPPVGDVIAYNPNDAQNQPPPPPQDTAPQVPPTKTILYTSECVTVCPLSPQAPQQPSNQFPQMQQ